MKKLLTLFFFLLIYLSVSSQTRDTLVGLIRIDTIRPNYTDLARVQKRVYEENFYLKYILIVNDSSQYKLYRIQEIFNEIIRFDTCRLPVLGIQEYPTEQHKTQAEAQIKYQYDNCISHRETWIFTREKEYFIKLDTQYNNTSRKITGRIDREKKIIYETEVLE